MQIIGILREVDAATPVAELARKHGLHAKYNPRLLE